MDTPRMMMTIAGKPFKVSRRPHLEALADP